MRTNSTYITKQNATVENLGCVAIATKCGRTVAAAQHLDSGLAERLVESRRRLGHLWHRAVNTAIARIQNAWQSAAQILNSAIDAGSQRPTKSAFYLMPVVGLVPVAVRRLPVAHAIGMPMPTSADC